MTKSSPENFSANKFQVLLITGAGTFLGTLDSSIVNVSLPTISRELDTTIDMVGWIILSYAITIISLLMVFGALSEKKGFRFSYIYGYGFFILGSFLCGISPVIITLVVSRVIQGIGAAFMMSVGAALITRAFPDNERGRGLSVIAMVVSVGLMSGPPLGGLIISTIGWRWIFFVNIPVGLLGMYFAIRYIDDYHATDPGRKISWPGAISLSLGLLGTILTILLYSRNTIGLSAMIFILIVPLISWILFFYFESKPQTRLIGLDIFKIKSFSYSGTSMLLVFIALASVTVLMPFYLEQVKNLRPDQVGLFLTIIPASILIMAPLAGYLADKVQARFISTLGIVVMSVGYYLILDLHADSEYLQIVIVLLLIGLGMGIFSTPNNSTIMGAVRQSQLGSASGILSTIRSVGLSFGVGLAIALFGIFKEQYASSQPDDIERFMFGYKSVYKIMIFAVIPAVIFSLLRGDGNRENRLKT